MKTFWPAGSILLIVTLFSLLCAASVWVDWLRHGDYLFWHLALMALALLMPGLLWKHKIETDHVSLHLLSEWRRQQICLRDIERIRIRFEGQRCVFCVYLPQSKRAALEAAVTNSRRADIKNLLDDLATKNAKSKLASRTNFKVRA